MERELSSFPIQSRADALNRLLGKQKLQLFQTSSGSIVYKEPSNVEDAAKVRGLNPEELLVWQVIKSSGQLGMWTRDMRIKTNLSQPQLTKILKLLETRKLIKTVTNVQNPSRKTYMVYELEPSRDLTGGAWYTEHQFDSEFIEVLRSACCQFIKQRGEATVREVADHIRSRGVSKVELRVEDIAMIVNTLVYDGRLDPVASSSSPGDREQEEDGEGVGQEGGERYRPALSSIPSTTPLTSVPCGTCPVSRDCQPGGVISPSTCIYMTQWLQF